MKLSSLFSLVAVVFGVLVLGSCSTLAVTFPEDFYMTWSDDYQPEMKTLGVVQVKRTNIAFLSFMDRNKIQQGMYEELIAKARGAQADGVLGVKTVYELSPFSVLSMFILSPTWDIYMEAIAIKKQPAYPTRTVP